MQRLPGGQWHRPGVRDCGHRRCGVVGSLRRSPGLSRPGSANITFARPLRVTEAGADNATDKVRRMPPELRSARLKGSVAERNAHIARNGEATRPPCPLCTAVADESALLAGAQHEA